MGWPKGKPRKPKVIDRPVKRRFSTQRAQAAIARVIKRRDALRAELAALDAEIAEMSAALGLPKPWPMMMPAPESEPSGPVGDLSPADSQGEGRWV